MSEINLAYIGNCGEEFSRVLRSYHDKHKARIACVCDVDVKRGLYCVEKYFCRFIEDYHVIIKDSGINLVIIENCSDLQKDVILDAINADKAICVLLSEKTLMEIDEISDEIRNAQGENGKVAVFVLVDELDNEFFANLPIARKQLGKLMNVSIGIAGENRDSLELQRRAYDSVKRLYELLGEPESMVSVSNRNHVGSDLREEKMYIGSAVFRYADGAIGHIMVGGKYQEDQICIYGTAGTAVTNRKEILYNLNGNGWKKKQIIQQKRRTRKLDEMISEAIKNGTWTTQHSIAEVACLGKMLRYVLDSQTDHDNRIKGVIKEENKA